LELIIYFIFETRLNHSTRAMVGKHWGGFVVILVYRDVSFRLLLMFMQDVTGYIVFMLTVSWYRFLMKIEWYESFF